MTIDVEALRLEVAKRHGVMLGRDDPIFVSVTLHELVVQAVIAEFGQALSEAERRSAARMVQEVATVKAAAERLIGGASNHVAGEIRKAAESGAQLVEKRLQAATQAAQKADSVRWAAIWAAGIAVAAALVTVGVVLGSAFN